MSKAAPTKLDVIRMKVLNYHQRMNEIAKEIKNPNLAIDVKKEAIQFYIDLPALERIYQFKNITSFHSLIVMFGVGEGNNPNQVTACILGVDANRNILSEHKGITIGGAKTDPIDGEDTWPPPTDEEGAAPANYFTLASNKTDIEKYLTT